MTADEVCMVMCLFRESLRETAFLSAIALVLSRKRQDNQRETAERTGCSASAENDKG
jgi:hypothetical protein